MQQNKTIFLMGIISKFNIITRLILPVSKCFKKTW